MLFPQVYEDFFFFVLLKVDGDAATFIFIDNP